jgi:predicted TIM-barrel fold metal-dependent hydrolase
MGRSRTGAACRHRSVDIRYPMAAVHEIRRCVKTLGFTGIRVPPWL